MAGCVIVFCFLYDELKFLVTCLVLIFHIAYTVCLFLTIQFLPTQLFVCRLFLFLGLFQFYATGMAKLLPFARKTCRWDTPLGIQRGVLYVEHYLGTKTTSRYKEFSTKNDNESSSHTSESKSVSVKQTGGEIQTTFTKVKETTKTASYVGVIVAGLGITAVIFYTVLKELFSSKSPNNIYSKALERCRNDPNVQNALGVPIKGFGEETRRGRRRHVRYGSCSYFK